MFSKGSNLLGASFFDATIDGSNFEDADLSQVNLEMAQLNRANLKVCQKFFLLESHHLVTQVPWYFSIRTDFLLPSF